MGRRNTYIPDFEGRAVCTLALGGAIKVLVRPNVDSGASDGNVVMHTTSVISEGCIATSTSDFVLLNVFRNIVNDQNNTDMVAPTTSLCRRARSPKRVLDLL